MCWYSVKFIDGLPYPLLEVSQLGDCFHPICSRLPFHLTFHLTTLVDDPLDPILQLASMLPIRIQLIHIGLLTVVVYLQARAILWMAALGVSSSFIYCRCVFRGCINWWVFRLEVLGGMWSLLPGILVGDFFEFGLQLYFP